MTSKANDPIEITPRHPKDRSVHVPGSKSYTHRTFIAAALSDGPCSVSGALDSEDTRLTLAALEKWGVSVQPGSPVRIIGSGGQLRQPNDAIYLKNSGTSMRLLISVAALCNGATELTGSDRMHERPVADLLDALPPLGISAISAANNGCPPVRIDSDGRPPGGATRIRCHQSSQYLSGLLLTAPLTRDGMNITVTGEAVSKPYIDMTTDILADFGIRCDRDGYKRFIVPGGQRYQPGEYVVETDCSQAGYFWAAAAITGARIKVVGTSTKSRQGDVGLAGVFGRMGCRVDHEADGIAVTGGPLTAITVDMADMPDMVPTLAVVAAHAQGTTRIENVAHLRIKESDRLGVMETELTKMGIDARCTEAGLDVTGGTPRGARIQTYDDHRIAMCFAVAGLITPGVIIEDPRCVDKSFPTFWDVFAQLE